MEGNVSSFKLRYENVTMSWIFFNIKYFLFSTVKYLFLYCSSMERIDHSLKQPVIAFFKAKVLISVPRRWICHALMSGMSLFSIIAIEYISSPEEHPALQMRNE